MKIAFNPYNAYNIPPRQINFGLRNPFTGTVPVEDYFVLNSKEKNKKNEDGFVSRFLNFFCKKEIHNSDIALQAFLDKKDKFQVSDFLKLSESERENIQSVIGFEYMIPAAMSINFAVGLKDKLDSEYGKDGYVFVSIGRSPSLIAKAFECMGVETRYLPMSKLTLPHIDVLMAENSFDKYGEFLESQGISAQQLANGDKKYIFYDYTSTGKTLKKFETLMRERFGLPEDKMEFRSIDEDLLSIFSGKVYIDDKDAVLDYIDTYFLRSGAEYYSSIESLPVNNIDEAEYSLELLTRHKDDEAKFFNFCVMNNLFNNGRLRENPANKVAL